MKKKLKRKLTSHCQTLMRLCVSGCGCTHDILELTNVVSHVRVSDLETQHTREDLYSQHLPENSVCLCEQMDLLWRMKLLYGLILAVAVLLLAEGHSGEYGCQVWDSNGQKEVCCTKCHPGEFSKGLNSGIK